MHIFINKYLYMIKYIITYINVSIFVNIHFVYIYL